MTIKITEIFRLLTVIAFILFVTGCGKVADQVNDDEQVVYVDKDPITTKYVSDIKFNPGYVKKNSEMLLFIDVGFNQGNIVCEWSDNVSGKDNFVVSSNSCYAFYKTPDEYTTRNIKVEVFVDNEIIVKNLILYVGCKYYCARFMVPDNQPGVVMDSKTNKMWASIDSSFSYNMTLADTMAKIDELNSISYLGYSDWRIPTIEEGQDLIGYGFSDFGDFADAYALGLFNDCGFEHYWMLNNGKYNLTEDYEFAIFFSGGFSMWHPVISASRLIPVRDF